MEKDRRSVKQSVPRSCFGFLAQILATKDVIGPPKLVGRSREMNNVFPVIYGSG